VGGSALEFVEIVEWNPDRHLRRARFIRLLETTTGEKAIATIRRSLRWSRSESRRPALVYRRDRHQPETSDDLTAFNVS
jgi:hypothetical protein